jgi:hypothetical protein
VDEKMQEFIESKKEAQNSSEKYEELLRQEEGEIRKHIGIEHQLKLQIEKLQEKFEYEQNMESVSKNL